MRKINKDNPIVGFNGNNFNNSCNNWSDFHEDHKDIFEESRSVILTDEQNQLCGYTEIYINDLKDCHIDHYKKKSMFPELTFEWNNLIVATKDSNFGANYKDNKSGIQKNNYGNIFNPVNFSLQCQYIKIYLVLSRIMLRLYITIVVWLTSLVIMS